MEPVSDTCRRIPAILLPQGEFAAKRSGYSVMWETPEAIFTGKTENGVRGINIPCTVVVKDGAVFIKDK